MQKFLKDKQSYSREHSLKKIEDGSLNVDILDSKENTLLMHVKDFDACAAMGATDWAISRSKYYFDAYMKNENRQYVFLDFNKPIGDVKSILGLTVDKGGEIQQAHYKDNSRADNSIKSEFIFNKLKTKKTRKLKNSQ